MNENGRDRLDAILLGILLVGMILALYLAFLEAPREKTMGDLQRIFYFHVPAGITESALAGCVDSGPTEYRGIESIVARLGEP